MSRKEKAIYLTFDDGPEPEVTPWVLQTLQPYHAKATFFCVGNNAKQYPDIIENIRQQGHCIGNHTMNHLNGKKTGTVAYIYDMNECHRILNADLFRPPYGKLKRSQRLLLEVPFKLIMWSVLSGDFDDKLDKDKCLSKLLTNTRNGSIVVFHDSQKAKEKLQYALPKFLEHFSGKGYEFHSLGLLH